MMKITGLSHFFKWENLHNWWLTKYFFAPLYIIYIYIWDNAWLALLMHEGGGKEPPDTKPCIIPFIPFASIDKLKLSIMFSVQNVTGRLKLYFKNSVFRLFY